MFICWPCSQSRSSQFCWALFCSALSVLVYDLPGFFLDVRYVGICLGMRVQLVEFRLYLLNGSTEIFQTFGTAREEYSGPDSIIKSVPYRFGFGVIPRTNFTLFIRWLWRCLWGDFPRVFSCCKYSPRSFQRVYFLIWARSGSLRTWPRGFWFFPFFSFPGWRKNLKIWQLFQGLSGRRLVVRNGGVVATNRTPHALLTYNT